MHLTKISANGQITVPAEIRRLLGLKSGDKILFFQKQDGEIVVSNASSTMRGRRYRMSRYNGYLLNVVKPCTQPLRDLEQFLWIMEI